MPTPKTVEEQLRKAMDGHTVHFEQRYPFLGVTYFPPNGFMPINPKKQNVRMRLRVEDKGALYACVSGIVIVKDWTLRPPYKLVEEIGWKDQEFFGSQPSDNEVIDELRDTFISSGKSLALDIIADPLYFIARLAQQPESMFNSLVSHFYFHEMNKEMKYIEGPIFALANALHYDVKRLEQSIEQAFKSRKIAKQLTR